MVSFLSRCCNYLTFNVKKLKFQDSRMSHFNFFYECVHKCTLFELQRTPNKKILKSIPESNNSTFLNLLSSRIH